ncbi:MAG: hypothetical protein LBI45_08815, partial [Bacteroidales bacterium]|nr:hypothetical protein [Bacteroidales bacterium]
GGGFDTNGYPVEPSESWSEPIPCHVKVNRKNNLGKQNGNSFTIASYEVLIDLQPFDAERIRINSHFGEIGEFSVLWTECLENVGAVKIVV